MLYLKSLKENLSGVEIIEEIKEISERIMHKGNEESVSGFSIITNKQNIKLLITDEQQCCERFGYLISNDDFRSSY